MNVGSIVQVNPRVDTFGGCMLVVTEMKTWGVMGYVQSAGVSGQQYVRFKFEDIADTKGEAIWMVE